MIETIKKYKLCNTFDSVRMNDDADFAYFIGYNPLIPIVSNTKEIKIKLLRTMSEYKKGRYLGDSIYTPDELKLYNDRYQLTREDLKPYFQFDAESDCGSIFSFIQDMGCSANGVSFLYSTIFYKLMRKMDCKFPAYIITEQTKLAEKLGFKEIAHIEAYNPQEPLLSVSVYKFFKEEMISMCKVDNAPDWIYETDSLKETTEIAC
jgi:hypothetical protein